MAEDEVGPFRRVLLKLSGEALCEPGGFGVASGETLALARQIASGLAGNDLELALILGGGNFLRGRQLADQGVDRPTADSMGMLATIMNALALQSALQSVGVETRVLSALHVHDVVEPFVRRRCLRHLGKRRVVILAGGTGHPYFTTDTTAALRGLEIGADAIYKGTKVDGVYSADPQTDPGAVLYERLGFSEAIEKQLQVMDSTAFSLCRDNKLPIVVFNMRKQGNIERALRGERLGTLVHADRAGS